MRIGNQDLNPDEAEWCIKFSKDVLAQACNQCVSALNKKCSEEDVAGLLKYLWSHPTQVSNDEAEAAEIADAEAEDDE